MDRLPTVSTVLLLTLALSVAAHAQTSAAGARDAALAGTSSAATTDLWSETNPAGWSQLRSFSAGVHAAQLYGLEELRLGAVQLAFDVRATTLAAGVRTFGYSDFRESVLTAGAARSVRWGTFRPLFVGLRLRHHRIAVRTYGAASASAVSAGLILPVLHSANLGMAIENLFIVSSTLQKELPRHLHSALSVSAGAVTFHGGISKEVRSAAALRFGVEFQAVDALALRAGYSLEPPRFAGGAGLRLPPLTVDVAAERHLVLGWSPSCSVDIRW